MLCYPYITNICLQINVFYWSLINRKCELHYLSWSFQVKTWYIQSSSKNLSKWGSDLITLWVCQEVIWSFWSNMSYYKTWKRQKKNSICLIQRKEEWEKIVQHIAVAWRKCGKKEVLNIFQAKIWVGKQIYWTTTLILKYFRFCSCSTRSSKQAWQGFLGSLWRILR